jgi:hypothetical protein
VAITLFGLQRNYEAAMVMDVCIILVANYMVCMSKVEDRTREDLNAYAPLTGSFCDKDEGDTRTSNLRRCPEPKGLLQKRSACNKGQKGCNLHFCKRVLEKILLIGKSCFAHHAAVILWHTYQHDL